MIFGRLIKEFRVDVDVSPSDAGQHLIYTYIHNDAKHISNKLIYTCEYETKTFVLSDIGGVDVEDKQSAVKILIDIVDLYPSVPLILEFVYKQIGDENG